MLMLEAGNRIIVELLTEKFNKPSSLDQTFVDFDSVRFHLSTPTKKTILLLSMEVVCWNSLVQYGAMEIVEKLYGNYLCSDSEKEGGYSVSLMIDLENLPEIAEERTELIKSFSLLKRNALAAPFERAFALQKHLEANPPSPDAPIVKEDIMSVSYRPEEAIYILPSSDRVTIIFSTIFKEETDRVFGKVFLQEFVDARRRPSCQTAPQVLYSNREPPLEVRHLVKEQGIEDSDRVGYVTFVLFPRHYATPEISYNSITQLQLFRDFLHFHIKASKAYIHSRLRKRVTDFLKILNRAKPEVVTDGGKSKTASGRTFVRV